MKPTIIAAISLMAFMVVSAQGASGSSQNHVEIYLTAQDTSQRLAKAGEAEFVDNLPLTEKEQAIFIDPSKTFQTVLGIGGALTDASAETFYKLPEAKQQEILRAYYDPQSGIGYSLGRTHIHSCDFSSESYSSSRSR